jgi:hypothetical protein
LSCLTTAVIALFCSVLFQKTSISLMTAYLVIVVLFCAPLAARFFAEGFFPDHPATPYVVRAGLTSPFAATFAVPLDVEVTAEATRRSVPGDLPLLAGFGVFTTGLNLALLSTMIWLFNVRWRVSQ